MVGISHDNVVEDFDLDKLAGSDEVASNFNVRFRRSWFAARMIVLCGAPHKLWQMMIADALAMTANLKISLG